MCSRFIGISSRIIVLLLLYLPGQVAFDVMYVAITTSNKSTACCTNVRLSGAISLVEILN